VTAIARPSAEPQQAVFVARQPIYTRRGRVYAYELLFRDSEVNTYPDVDPSTATARLLTSTVATTGIDRLSDGRPLFVNFTRELLVGEYFRLLPRGRVVLEVLEDVDPDPEVLAALEAARAARHVIALDDVSRFDPERIPFYELADILKVDFRATTAAERPALTRALRPHAPTLLAEKVENDAETAEARALGYDLLQGYALGRPLMMRARGLAALSATALELLRLASDPHASVRAMELVIQNDVALTYRLMRLVNSAANGLGQRVTAIRHALTMLGQAELVRVASLLVLAGASGDRPGEIARSSLIRARAMEALAAVRWPDRVGAPYYLTGIFSRLDEMLGVPMAEVLERLPVVDEVAQALMGRPGEARMLLDLVAHYEAAEWDAADAAAARLRLAPELVARVYPAAVAQADMAMSSI